MKYVYQELAELSPEELEKIKEEKLNELWQTQKLKNILISNILALQKMIGKESGA